MSSELKTNKVSPATGTALQIGDSGDTVDIPSGATFDVTGATVTGLSAGKVLQVVSFSINTAESNTGTSFVNTALEATITPASTSNKVLVIITPTIGCDTYGFSNMVRGSTNLNQGIAGGSRIQCTMGVYIPTTASTGICTMTYLDSPSTTSATTYRLALRPYNSGTIYLNRSHGDTDANHTPRASSTITLMEIAG
jgi:hypothetical protein|tara:strand:- start:264 stop:851 length:588 start_codon:yes stop_codon:yes gene_type:complete